MGFLVVIIIRRKTYRGMEKHKGRTHKLGRRNFQGGQIKTHKIYAHRQTHTQRCIYRFGANLKLCECLNFGISSYFASQANNINNVSLPGQKVFLIQKSKYGDFSLQTKQEKQRFCLK